MESSSECLASYTPSLAARILASRIGRARIHCIVIFIFGGIAEFAREPESPGSHFLNAVVGPAARVATAAVFFTFHSFFSGRGGEVLLMLSKLNLVLAAFNLVPAFPLDRGRNVRALIWKWKGAIAPATAVAIKSGTFASALLLSVAIFDLLMSHYLRGLWWFVGGMTVEGISSQYMKKL